MKDESKEDSLVKRNGIVKYSSYSKLIRVTARILSFYGQSPIVSCKNALKTPDVESLNRGKHLHN